MRFIDIRKLKQWSIRYLKQGSKLREILVLEDDFLLPEEYLAKMDVWLKLVDLEK